MRRQSIDRRLERIVDRTEHEAAFRSLLDTGSRILALVGAGGTGKSTTIGSFLRLCDERGIDPAIVEWTDERRSDYVDVMRAVRDQLDGPSFDGLTDLLNWFTVPGYPSPDDRSPGGDAPASMDETADIVTDTDAGSVASTKEPARIADRHSVTLRPDLDISPADRRARLTATFVDALAQRTIERPIVLFFDAAEKMPVDTLEWLTGPLLDAFTRERLPNVRLVVAGRDRIQPFEQAPLVHSIDAGGFDADEVERYLERRGIAPEDRGQIAAMLMTASAGNPLQVATLVDMFLSGSHA
jgi:AAA ATPase domain